MRLQSVDVSVQLALHHVLDVQLALPLPLTSRAGGEYARRAEEVVELDVVRELLVRCGRRARHHAASGVAPGATHGPPARPRWTGKNRASRDRRFKARNRRCAFPVNLLLPTLRAPPESADRGPESPAPVRTSPSPRASRARPRQVSARATRRSSDKTRWTRSLPRRKSPVEETNDGCPLAEPFQPRVEVSPHRSGHKYTRIANIRMGSSQKMKSQN